MVDWSRYRITTAHSSSRGSLNNHYPLVALSGCRLSRVSVCICGKEMKLSIQGVADSNEMYHWIIYFLYFVTMAGCIKNGNNVGYSRDLKSIAKWYCRWKLNLKIDLISISKYVWQSQKKWRKSTFDICPDWWKIIYFHYRPGYQ